MNNKNLRDCKRCLLKDFDMDAYYETVLEYIESISEELKVPPEEYQRRLELCRECDKLLSGMCRVCGCFAEVRAVKKDQRCPDVHPQWQPYTE